MAIKVTFFFELRTAGLGVTSFDRLAGWTETWYFPGDSPETANTAATKSNGWMAKRAALLGTAGIVKASRYVNTAVPGRSRIDIRSAFRGTWQDNDIPQMALLCRSQTADNQYGKNWFLRGLPDSVVKGGEFNPGTTDFLTLLTGFFATIRGDGWQFRSLDRGAAQRAILNGNVATAQITHVGAGIFGIGEKVRIVGARSALGRVRGWTATVVASAAAGVNTLLTLSPYRAGSDLVAGGQVKLVSPIFNTAAVNSYVRVNPRKVGRPFGQYRGRSSPPGGT